MDGSTPETGPVVPTPEEAPLTITGKPEDAWTMQRAAEAAQQAGNGVEQNPTTIVPGTEIVVPDFVQQRVTETTPVEVVAPIELPPPPASVGPAPELPPFLAAGQNEGIPNRVEIVPIRPNPFEPTAPVATPELPQQ